MLCSRSPMRCGGSASRSPSPTRRAASLRSTTSRSASTRAKRRGGLGSQRLERVAKRFERIGRPARREPVGLGTIAERVVAYFRPRLPTLAHSVTITLTSPGAGPTATGDPVLIEWALEVVVKNAVDALSGRGGRIDVEVQGSDSLV